MPLTDQPYIPFYVKDWMTNTKLKMCSPEAHGLMINIMCILHKEESYGQLLLNQKYKQTGKQISNFALQLAKLTPFDREEIEGPLSELINEKVLYFDGEYLICKRMIEAANLSIKRSEAGKKGGKKTQEFAKAKHKAKSNQNTVNANAIVNIEERIQNFKNKVWEIGKEKYSVEMCKAFCNYWTQVNDGEKKMLFEKQKAFQIPNRLATWHSKDYNKNGTDEKPKKTLREIKLPPE